MSIVGVRKSRKFSREKCLSFIKWSAYEQRSAIPAIYATWLPPVSGRFRLSTPLDIARMVLVTSLQDRCYRIFKPAQALTRARLGYSIILRRVVSTPVFLPRRDSLWGVEETRRTREEPTTKIRGSRAWKRVHWLYISRFVGALKCWNFIEGLMKRAG